MSSTLTPDEMVRTPERRIDDTLDHYAVEVVPTVPTRYPRQHGLTCGEFNVRVLLDAFGIEFTANPEPRPRERLFGLSFTDDIVGELLRHGVGAEVRTAADLHDDSRIALLRGHIDSHEPVILAIGNGHLSRDRDSALARALIGHFITIYGYDADAGVFFVYDPYLAGDPPDRLPAGNDVRSEQEILRDWRGPFYYSWIGMDHTYIPVGV